MLLNLYHLRCSTVSFTHNYRTRQVENNVFRLRKCNTEFEKRDPFNISIEINNILGINTATIIVLIIIKNILVLKLNLY